MYIKQIIIQGFKSYKDQTVIEPFSSGTNVIVGRNGSGKSNFFAAIRFVLSDAYTQMNREERQALLHEGSGSAVMSAYVEIIFDNSDDRFPTGGKEVILRRTIGTKKDEYSLDRKVVTKNDVTNLLEAAGFSRSNPYYIVPQGRVTALTNMKEADRLNLLKEVAGTQVYEARRAESQKIMYETNNKRSKIDELLDYIKERLAELEEEKEELRGFQDKDRERRCLEYALYHQEQERFQEQLERIENIRQNGLESTDSIQTELKDAEKAIAQLDNEINQLHREMELLKLDRNGLEEDRRESSREQAKTELKVKSLSDGQSATVQAQRQHESDLREVRKEIAAKEKELEKLAPLFDERKKEESDARLQLEMADSSRQRLISKQTRSSQFRSKGERDAWLQDEISELHSSIMKQKANKVDAEEEVARVGESIEKLNSDIAELRSKLEGFSGSRSQLMDKTSTAKEAYDRLSEQKKELRRSEEKLEKICENAQNERDQAERHLGHAMNSDTSHALRTVRRLKLERDFPGAHGTIAELMKVNEAYRLAAEQIAGNQLFQYVVDNSDTATDLLQALHSKSGGRVTCIPLAQVRPKAPKLPRSSDGVVPLLSKIEYDPKYEKAFQMVFGNAVVCPNLHIATQYAKSHNVDAVTPDGDQANKRGAMTGGYIDPKASRLEAVQRVNETRDEADKLGSQLQEVRQLIQQKEQEITRSLGELRKAEQSLHQLEASFSPLNYELSSKNNYLEKETEHLARASERRENVEKNMKDFHETLSAHEAELSSDFKKALTAAEDRQLGQLGDQVKELQRQWGEASTKRRDVEKQRQIIETSLNQNLRLRLDQLNTQAFEISSAGPSGGLKEAQRELDKLTKQAAAAESRLGEIEERIEDMGNTIDEREAMKAQQEQRQSEVAAKEAKQRSMIEKSMSKKALYTAQAADAAKAIRDLGVLPDDFDKYENLDSKQIDSRLKKVRNALKKYQHVNKKAFEQYNSFTSQQDQLLKRRAELDSSQESIEELVRHLDQRKDEAIERTFKQVSKEFAGIFEKLVPAGHGRLVIQRRSDRARQPQPDDESEDEEQRGTVENYTGVGISVSFNSKTLDEQQRIQQLSGGQKSLCALCLIFALQQTESSPMVIFDEVDANLDAQYRTAVAALLQSISRDAGTQFICTTFRPEIVHVADKSYGVTFNNKSSAIDVVPEETALGFVEGQAKGQK